MSRTVILLLAVLFSVIAHGQEAKKSSPAVTRILDEAVRAVKRNRVDFDKANQKPLGEARKALDDLSTKLIKDGKADEAAAVLRQVGTLEADVMRMANAPAPLAGGGAVRQKPLMERIVGKWSAGDYPEYFMVNDGGAWMQVKNDGKGTVIESVAMQLLDYETAEVRYRSGWRLQCRLAGDDVLAVTEIGPDGRKSRGFALERVR